MIDARTIYACIDEIVRDLIKRKQERGDYGDSAKSYGMPGYEEIPPRYDSKPTHPKERDMLGATFTASKHTDKVTVIRFTTTPTGSSEPLWYAVEMTVKEWACEQIRQQPFFVHNRETEG